MFPQNHPHNPLPLLLSPRGWRSPPPPTRAPAAPPLSVQIAGHAELRRRFLYVSADKYVLGRLLHAGIVAALRSLRPPRSDAASVAPAT